MFGVNKSHFDSVFIDIAHRHYGFSLMPRPKMSKRGCACVIDRPRISLFDVLDNAGVKYDLQVLVEPYQFRPQAVVTNPPI
jgi:hypothetical protein